MDKELTEIINNHYKTFYENENKLLTNNLLLFLKYKCVYFLENDNIENIEKIQFKDLFQQFISFDKDNKLSVKSITIQLKNFSIENPNIIKILKPKNKVTYHINYKFLIIYFMKKKN